MSEIRGIKIKKEKNFDKIMVDINEERKLKRKDEEKQTNEKVWRRNWNSVNPRSFVGTKK